MLPQIIVTIWLTVTWLIIAVVLDIERCFDMATVVVLSTIYVAIAAVALHFGGFWSI